MKTKLTAALISSASIVLSSAGFAHAEDGSAFTWEGSLEIGLDEVISSNTPRQ